MNVIVQGYMTSFRLDPKDPTPLYAQLERAIRTAIATGKLQPGAQLPTVRQLAVDLHVNANTVARVYAALERTEVVETQRGVGTFVRATPPAVVTRKSRTRAGADHLTVHPGVRRPRLHDRRVDRHLNAGPNRRRKSMLPIVSSSGLSRRDRNISISPIDIRINFVAVLILVFSILSGIAFTAITQNPLWVLLGALTGGILSAVTARREAVGARRRSAPRPIHRTARPWNLLGSPVLRQGHVVDRPARHHDELRGRGDADVRHGSGERRRRAVLDGARFREGRARSAGLRAGRELGGADRVCATSSAARRSPICCAAASRSRPSFSY